ncbi:MAG: twin-arginine translocase subunit TatC [Bdellovibrionaceae bacterium]|nr:twin-arginine translocase subunit TatC [Pseudobdellovibrionaceae bacterium]
MSETSTPNQTLIEHLGELRFRLVRSAWGVLVGIIICYNFTHQIFDWMRAPIAPYLPTGGLVFTGPMDKFLAHLKIAFFGGVVIASPWLLYQIWKFVSPGLYRKERKLAISFITSGTLLFLTGIAFTYFVVLPMAFHFLMTYGGDVDKPMITIDQYMGFVTITALMFGLSFELPLVIVTLALLGVVDQAFLRRNRKYAVMTIAIICAVITPPDLLSMLLMLAPMWFLLEASIIIVGMFERKKAREAALAKTPEIS